MFRKRHGERLLTCHSLMLFPQLFQAARRTGAIGQAIWT